MTSRVHGLLLAVGARYRDRAFTHCDVDTRDRTIFLLRLSQEVEILSSPTTPSGDAKSNNKKRNQRRRSDFDISGCQ